MSSRSTITWWTPRPTIYFLHYWGTGPADKLATAFKAALGELAKPTKATAGKN